MAKKAPPCGKASVVALSVLLLGALALALAAVFMPQVKEHMTQMPSVIVIHAKWCGHCKTLLAKGGPWEKLKKGLPGVKFLELDESTLKGMAAVKKYKVQGFPDIRIISSSGATVSTYSGEERSEGAMRAWVLENVAPLSSQKKKSK